MNTRLIGVFAVVCVAGMAAAEDLKAAIQGQVKAFDIAMVKKDASWFEHAAAPDYREQEAGGKMVDRATAIAMMKQSMQAVTAKKCHSKVLSVERTKGGARAIVTTEMEGTMRMPNSKKLSKLVGFYKFEQEYVKIGNSYKIRTLKTISQKTTLDGKPFNGMG